MTHDLRGYDIDGTLTTSLKPIKPYVVISGRTLEEYNGLAKQLAAEVPVYIRGTGKLGDAVHAGSFKARMINILGIKEFYEDDDTQIQVIRRDSPWCKIMKVSPDGSYKEVF